MRLREPVTVKRTVTPEAGLPKASLTVAVTQCWVPTTLLAVAGLSTSVAGAAATYVFAAAPVGSVPFWEPPPSVSANALIASAPTFVPV